MDCPLTVGNLIGYQFATLPDDERRQVEEHLVECKACLRSYLALKAHVDGQASGREAESPSEAARLRLRAAVQARFRPTPARRMGRLLSRPFPLYQGLAIAAITVLVLALAPAIARAFHPEPTLHASERVDTARRSPESLTLY